MAAARSTWRRSAPATQRDGIGLNVGLMVPHGSVRREVLGDVRPRPDGGRARAAWWPWSATACAPARSGCRAASTTRRAATRRPTRSSRWPGPRPPAAAATRSHIRDEADYGVGVVAAVRRGDHHRRAGRPDRRRHPHEGARAGELGLVEDDGRAHRGGARARRAASSPISIPTRPAAPASSAR